MSGTPVEELLILWLDEMPRDVRESTRDMRRGHVLSHLVPFFHGHSEVTPDDGKRYVRERLKRVLAKTVRKELSTLRSFCEWASDAGHFAAVEIEGPSKRTRGTPYEVRRRGKPTELTQDECRRLIAALPEWSNPRNGYASFPVRARFVVAYETGLRPATLNALRVPEHYAKGERSLRISDAIDKAYFGREVPLTAAAREALDLVSPERGLIFGRHDYRWQLAKAAQVVKLPEHKAATLAQYDFRHARATQLAEQGNLTGLGYLLGHRRATTTDRYVRPNLASARTLIESDESLPECPTGIPGRPVGEPSARDETLVRRRGLEPPRVLPHQNLKSAQYRTLALNADPVRELLTEADAILDLAASRSEVDVERLHAFARSVLDAVDLARLAVAVLEGGSFAGTRAVELAAAVLRLELSLEGNGDCCTKEVES